MLTFQQIIHRLTEFWEKRGCIIHQGHDLEVGAGTFNPATFLRCLGPEPYKTAYVEPSRRPGDGRYGENPNRVQLFHQYQVIIKPSPADIKDVYLQSLEAIGFDLKKHDIRFVHDDWESPTLGAWGLGWEVWSDGMEVTQFTYFQAIGSLPLKPVSVEITYGLERLAMFIQNVDNIFDVKWNNELTLRDISHQNEIEWSTYNFTEASTSMWMRHFEDYEKEAKTLIAKGIPIPAYDFVLKASHAFNMLDARGVISVTERTGYIARIRDLARLVATEYLTTREKQGFPLLSKLKPKQTKPYAPKIAAKFSSDKKQDMLFEIGSEQLPATFIPIGCNSLERMLTQLFSKYGLSFEEMKIYGTPQRIAASIKGLVEGSPDQQIEKKGPPLSTAFDAAGYATAQGMGFFKSLGFSSIPKKNDIENKKVKGFTVKAIKEIDYVFYTYEEKGKSTLSILSDELPKLIAELDFPKKMRWGDLDVAYPRPIHWILALFGDKVIPMQFGDIISDRTTKGHAQLSPKKISIRKPKDYVSSLKKHYVLVDREERKQSILKQLATLEKKLKGKALEKEKVLAQVTNLVEWPQLTYATFDMKFLKAPQEVLISEMVEHQKYFPLADAKGKLKNFFIISADNKPNMIIRKGNQKVLSARLSDGVFLYDQDVKTPLESFNEKLKIMTFQKELGSVMDKVLRIANHAEVINKSLALADNKHLLRAALLCKADLASALVGEFPQLQGTIGKYYALAQNEHPEVASAIEEHWMPTSETSPLPSSPSAVVLSLADKIDNLLCYFSIGLKPTSSSDPYALRRQTLGLLKILLKAERSFDLREILEQCSQHVPMLSRDAKLKGQVVQEILTFITARSKTVFEDLDFRKDEIEASLQGVCMDPYDQLCKIKALSEFRSKAKKEFHHFFEVYKRSKGFLVSAQKVPFNSSLAKETAEQHLIEALSSIGKKASDAIASKNYFQAFQILAMLQPYLATFLDAVKIMVEDTAIRENRIALLQNVFSYFEELLDFSKIQDIP